MAVDALKYDENNSKSMNKWDTDIYPSIIICKVQNYQLLPFFAKTSIGSSYIYPLIIKCESQNYQFLSFFPEIFIGSSLIFFLVCGSLLESSPKYNYPIICFQSNTMVVLVWILLLCQMNLYTTLTPYFVVDNLGSITKIFLGLGLLGCLGVSKTEKIKAYEYYVLTLLGLLGLCFIASSQDFLSIYLGLELISLSFYILASFQRYSAFSTEAGLKYFLLGAISSALLLFGISISYGFSGTINLSHMASLFIEASEESQVYFKFIQIGLFFFTVGLFFKLGVVPFHGWLPDVYEGAPTSVTVIFAVLPKIAIFVILIRFLNSTSPYLWNSLFLSLALLSLFVGSLASLYQTKIKRLLAYSGISHVGYALVALSCGTLDSTSASIFYIFIYIVTSLFLWGLLICVENKGGRSLYLTDIIIWGKTNIVLAFTAILVVFSIAGIPPLGGFFAKFAVFASSIEVSLYYGTLLGVLTSAFGILYYLRLVKFLSFEESTIYSYSTLSKLHALSMGVAALFLVFFIFFGNSFSYMTYAISMSSI